MALFKNDVSEYVTSGRLNPARLVVTFTPVDGSPDRYAVKARVDDDGEITAGQFAARPEWRSPDASLLTSKSYPVEPQRAKVGTQLFSALFSGALSRCWAQAVERGRQPTDRGRQRGLHIIIRSSSYAVHALPWELLSDPTPTSSEYVAFSDGWSVLRDTLAPGLEATPDVRELPDPVLASDLALLVMTTSIVGVDQNADSGIINGAFPYDGVRTVPDAGPEQILDALESHAADIVHFMGIGEQSRHGRQDLLVGKPDKTAALSGKALAKTLKDASRLRLAVFAACETDQLAAQLASVIPAVIGIRGIISDTSCQAFLGGFYVALAAGATLSQAVASGRTQQLGFSQSLGDEWAQPVLFLKQDGPIVRPTSPGGDTTMTVLELGDPESQAGTEAEKTTGLLLQIKEANLGALREQWGKVEKSDAPADTPAFVQEQIDRLREEVEALRGAGG